MLILLSCECGAGVESGPHLVARGGLVEGGCFVAEQNNCKAEPWKTRAAAFARVAPVVVAVEGALAAFEFKL